jgi:hypothetical protein
MLEKLMDPSIQSKRGVSVMALSFLRPISPVLSQFPECSPTLLYEQTRIGVSVEHITYLLDQLVYYLGLKPRLLKGPFCPSNESMYYKHLLRVVRLADYLLLPDEHLDILAIHCCHFFLLSKEWGLDLFPPLMESRIRSVWAKEMETFGIFWYYQDPCECEDHRTRYEFVKYNDPVDMKEWIDPFHIKLTNTNVFHELCRVAIHDTGYMTCGMYDEQLHRYYIHYELYATMYTEFEQLRKTFEKDGHTLHPVPTCLCATCYDIRMYCFHSHKTQECHCSYCDTPKRMYTKEQLHAIDTCMKLVEKETQYMQIHKHECVCIQECLIYG